MAEGTGPPLHLSDDFMMHEFKIRPCDKNRPHSWVDCCFAHKSERACRRPPSLYSGAACVEFRRAGVCAAGDACPMAHGVFESWLHPSRYKTQVSGSD